MNSFGKKEIIGYLAIHKDKIVRATLLDLLSHSLTCTLVHECKRLKWLGNNLRDKNMVLTYINHYA